MPIANSGFTGYQPQTVAPSSRRADFDLLRRIRQLEDDQTTSTAGAWSTLTLASGWTPFGGLYSPGQYRQVGDMVQCRGTIKHAGNGFDTIVFTLPTGVRPAVSIQPLVRAPGGGAFFNLDFTGVATLKTDSTGTTTPSVSFDFQFSLTP